MLRIFRKSWIASWIALAVVMAPGLAFAAEPPPSADLPQEDQAAVPASETAQEATQPNTFFPAWSLKSNRNIDPRVRPNAGIRVPTSYFPIEGGPLLYPAFSPEEPDFRGGDEPVTPWSVRTSIGLFGLDDEHVSAKFQEFRDVRNGVAAGVEGHFRSGDSLFNIVGRQIGRRDQDLVIDGGRAGGYRWSLNYDETPHNYAFDAKSLWSGIGTASLTLPDAMQTDLQSSTTNAELAAKLLGYVNGGAETIDESLRRQSVGGELTLLTMYPFVVKAAVSNESRDGVRPWSASFGFANFVEVPWPVKYDTHELRISGEYAKPESRVYASASVRYSEFVNHIQTFTFDNPDRIVNGPGGLNCTFACGPSTGRMALYPSNQYHELSGTVVVKKLPLNSTFNAHVSTGYLRQDERLQPFSTNAADPLMRSPVNPSFNATDPAGLPRQTAETAMDTQTVSMRWASNFSKKTNFVAQYRLYRVDNDQEPFTMFQFVREDEDIRNPETVGGTYTAVLAQYTKQTGSVEGSYHFNPDLKAMAAYTYERMDRDFREVARMNDNKLKLAVDWRLLGSVELKTSYEHAERTTSDYDFDQYNIVQGNPAAYPMVPWLEKFDQAPHSRDEAQVMATVFINDAMSVSAHAQIVSTDFGVVRLAERSMTNARVTAQASEDLQFGLRWDRRRSFGADFTYAPSERFSAFLDAGYDHYEGEQMARQWTLNGISDPYRRQPVLQSNSNWIARARDNYYSAGAGIEATLIPERLTLSMQYAFGKSDGRQEYESPVGTNAVDDVNAFIPMPFDDVDDTRTQSLNPELEYKYNERLSLAAGYHWEEWHVNDYNYKGFSYVPLYTNGVALLMGGLLPKAYSANAVYVRVKMGL